MRGSFEFARKLFKIEKAVEIGVYEGENALDMLRHGVGFLYLVDPYRAHMNNSLITDEATFEVTQEEMDQAKADMLKRVEAYPGKTQLLEFFSEEAAQAFKDDSLDFVYIDSVHSYDEVKKDISFWYPKVRKGGVLGGHDYVTAAPGRAGYLGLIRAVDEFVKEKGVHLYTGGADWWVVKI